LPNISFTIGDKSFVLSPEQVSFWNFDKLHFNAALRGLYSHKFFVIMKDQLGHDVSNFVNLWIFRLEKVQFGIF
jgi:hypothetical protein